MQLVFKYIILKVNMHSFCKSVKPFFPASHCVFKTFKGAVSVVRSIENPIKRTIVGAIGFMPMMFIAEFTFWPVFIAEILLIPVNAVNLLNVDSPPPYYNPTYIEDITNEKTNETEWEIYV